MLREEVKGYQLVSRCVISVMLYRDMMLYIVIFVITVLRVRIIIVQYLGNAWDKAILSTFSCFSYMEVYSFYLLH